MRTRFSEPQIAALRAAGAGGEPFAAALAVHKLRGRCRSRQALRTAAQSTIAALERRGLLKFEPGVRPNPFFYVITTAGRAVLAMRNGAPAPTGDGFSVTGEVPAVTPPPVRGGNP